MVQIVLTPDQAALLKNAEGPIYLVDPRGRTVGDVKPTPVYFTDEEIAEIEARLGKEGPGITTAELLAKLRSE